MLASFPLPSQFVIPCNMEVGTAGYIFSGARRKLQLKTLLSQNFYCTTVSKLATHYMTQFSGLTRASCERIINPHPTSLVAMVR